LLVLGIVRDVYYESDRTPGRPAIFDADDELFGKATDLADADTASTPFSSASRSG